MRQSENSTEGAEQPAAGLQASRVADSELAQRIAFNFPGVIEELIEQHGDHLQRLIGSLCGWSSASDDLMQETLLKAWSSAKSYRGDAPLRHWLTQIAVRVCRNHQRGYRRWLTHLNAIRELRTDQQRAAPTNISRDLDCMQQAMAKLSYSDRELLVLYYFEDQSMSDVASRLGVKASTMHVRVHRARERLKTLLQNAEDLP